MASEPDKYGIYKNTCTTCAWGKFSSNMACCIKCLKEDAPGNRFPNWEAKDGKETS